VLFLLLLQFNQFLLQSLLKAFDQFLVVSLNVGDLDLCLLKNVVFYLVAVTLHGNGEPLLQAGFQCPRIFVFFRSILHCA
jgi:hypothetical protein